MPSKITIKKVAQGKYVVFKDKDKVMTATFTKKYYPMPNLPKGFEMSFQYRGSKPLKTVVRNITEGRQKLLKEASKRRS